MNEMRRNGIVGAMEETEFDKTIHIHFSEWWSGEGMDFNVERVNHKGQSENCKYSLSLTEMSMLASVMMATGMIDLDEVLQRADKLNKQSTPREEVLYESSSERDSRGMWNRRHARKSSHSSKPE